VTHVRAVPYRRVVKAVASGVLVAAAGFVLAGCGSGAKQTAHYTTSPPTTVAGVGVTTNGPPPKPSTPTGCVRRWNGAANTSGRATAKQRASKANAALVRTAGATGYFSEDAGRCLIYLITPPKSAVVFVEVAPGKFAFAADATGHFAANADLQQRTRLQLR
jgi:hypothetical protein